MNPARAGAGRNSRTAVVSDELLTGPLPIAIHFSLVIYTYGVRSNLTRFTFPVCQTLFYCELSPVPAKNALDKLGTFLVGKS